MEAMLSFIINEHTDILYVLLVATLYEMLKNGWKRRKKWNLKSG